MESAGAVIAQKKKHNKLFGIIWKILAAVAAWAIITWLLQLIFNPETGEMEAAHLNTDVFPGTQINSSIVIEWGFMLLCVVAALLLRVFVINKFSEKPKGAQNALEFIVKTCEDYANKYVHDNGFLGGYIFALGVFLICAAISEVLGLRSPASDINVTGALGLCTFILINYYGIRKTGVLGRIKWFMKPAWFMFPINIVTTCVIPVSLACRLFGNILGGMIILELLYHTLGVASVGPIAGVGLFFSVFHPLIQAYIFITLTLTFINEAVEMID